MNILHVTPSYKPAYIYGGPIESVGRLCEALQATGNSVTVFTTTANGDKELAVEPNKELIVDNVSVTYFSRITKDPTHISLKLWWSLYKRCKEFDVVHIHSWWNVLVIIAAVICHLRNVKVVISPRGMLSDYIITTSHSQIKKWIHKLIGKSALEKSTFHATSDLEYEECKRVIPGWKGFLIPNILELPSEAVLRTENAVFTMLFLSRIHPKKGLELLFESISQLDANVKLKIAGKGDENYIQELKQLVSTLTIEQKVDWVGWKSRGEKFKELAAADMFVLTSFNENFANVVIESLSVGTPVFISDKVGLSDYILANDLGWVTELNTASIVASLKSAISDQKKRDFIAKNGRANIFNTFSEKILVESYLKNYKEVLGLSPSEVLVTPRAQYVVVANTTTYSSVENTVLLQVNCPYKCITKTHL
ncbi:XrtY-associated glycosyltransferase XYAG1 [Spirosoma sp. KNUC1025]|uniref:XrtY-associated glycosyltransferase XYAG1 n=1 Tax=Spirosoma sp. KNUC1025 TaxID=2894082 RepID=UPI00386CD731|nr:glycosyltransferase [Spirosoma sp. KNUC1025]